MIYMLALLWIYPESSTFADTATLTVCYNFGCNTRGNVQPTQSEINLLENYFHNTNSGIQERAQIALAIASMEQIVARYLPTGNDKAGNYTVDMIEDGKQDCIDESTNTTTYLNFFQQHGWLHWHTVGERAHRSPYLFDDHWAAQVIEKDTGKKYVVDSWYRDNGLPPVIQTLENWKSNRDIYER